MSYPMFLVELSEEGVFILLSMITPYPDILLKLSIYSHINFRNNILKALNVSDFSLRKLTYENLE